MKYIYLEIGLSLVASLYDSRFGKCGFKLVLENSAQALRVVGCKNVQYSIKSLSKN